MARRARQDRTITTTIIITITATDNFPAPAIAGALFCRYYDRDVIILLIIK